MAESFISQFTSKLSISSLSLVLSVDVDKFTATKGSQYIFVQGRGSADSTTFYYDKAVAYFDGESWIVFEGSENLSIDGDGLTIRGRDSGGWRGGGMYIVQVS